MKKIIYAFLILAGVALSLTFACNDSPLSDVTPLEHEKTQAVAYQRIGKSCVTQTPDAISFKAVGQVLADGTTATVTTLSVGAAFNTCYSCIVYKLTNKRTGATTYEPASGVSQNKISVNIFSYPTPIGGVFSAVGDTITASAACTNNVNLFTAITPYSLPTTYIIPQK